MTYRYGGFSWLLGVCLVATACKRSPGSFCQPREAHCLDEGRALLCSGGTLREVPCRGKEGCSSKDGKTSCDFSGNRPGDRCTAEDEGVAVCESPGSLLVCRGEVFASVPCRGPGGCERRGEQAHCDHSVAQPGERCQVTGAKACAPDGGSVLACGDGYMRELYRCRGQGGCRAEGSRVACDQTVARLGDLCDKTSNGHMACSEDDKGLVTCKDEHFVPAEKCKAGTRCAVSGQSTRCERR